jgi:hypothetical protein
MYPAGTQPQRLASRERLAFLLAIRAPSAAANGPNHFRSPFVFMDLRIAFPATPLL